MHNQQCILPHPRGVRIWNVHLLAGGQVKAQRHEWLALKFLLDIFRGHIGIVSWNRMCVHYETTASASISINAPSSMSLATCTMVVAGRISLNTSKWARA